MKNRLCKYEDLNRLREKTKYAFAKKILADKMKKELEQVELDFLSWSKEFDRCFEFLTETGVLLKEEKKKELYLKGFDPMEASEEICKLYREGYVTVNIQT